MWLVEVVEDNVCSHCSSVPGKVNLGANEISLQNGNRGNDSDFGNRTILCFSVFSSVVGIIHCCSPLMIYNDHLKKRVLNIHLWFTVPHHLHHNNILECELMCCVCIFDCDFNKSPIWVTIGRVSNDPRVHIQTICWVWLPRAKVDDNPPLGGLIYDASLPKPPSSTTSIRGAPPAKG